jgi:hypothetical protein
LSKVRRWIRTVRDIGHVEWLRTRGAEWLALVDRDVLGILSLDAPTNLVVTAGCVARMPF